MKILLAAILFAVPVIAKTLVLEVCASTHCYNQSYYDVKSATPMTDFKDRRFVRIVFRDGRELDVQWSEIVSFK